MSYTRRELRVLDVLGSCNATGVATLEIVFGNQPEPSACIPADELAVVLEMLERKGLIARTPGSRTDVITITDAGRALVVKEKQRHA